MTVPIPLPHVVPYDLVAGSLSVRLAGVDLVDVRWGGHEIAQRIYVAVRDAPWNTIPGIIEEREISQSEDRFAVSFRCRHQFGDIDFEWNGLIEGWANGTLSYRLSGQAQSDFEYSKIGLNVHHPVGEYRERSYRAMTETGESITGTLPSAIDPQLIRDGSLTAMFDDFRQITFDLDGLSAAFAFSGDDFEMQDHRNWADANYKTYGTPMKRGFPFAARSGDRFDQGLVIKLVEEPGLARGTSVPSVPDLQFEEQAAGFPQLGQLWVSPAGREAREVASSIRPDFLRLEVDEVAHVLAELEQTRAAFAANPVAIELVLNTVPGEAAADARALAHALATPRVSSVPVLRVIVLQRAEGFSATKVATPADLVSDFVIALRASGSTLPVFSGTEQNFNEINRSRPAYAGTEGIAFSYNPQVHAADDLSLMHNAATILDIAESTRMLYPGIAISVGPVRLLGPAGPYPAGPAGPGEIPTTVDVRQRALFGAAWTVAFLRSCVAAKIEAATLFSLAGEGGVLDSPIGWVLERLREDPPVNGSRVWVSAPGDDRLAGIRWITGSGTRTVVANLRDESVVVHATTLGLGAPGPRLPSGSVTARLLDGSGVETRFTAADWSAVAQDPPGRSTTIALAPFAIVCVDELAGLEES